MFGTLLGSALRIVTLPVDAVNAGLDIVTGGTGSKRERIDSPLGFVEEIRDRVAETLEDID